MRFVTCEFCGQRIEVKEDSNDPQECPNCLSPIKSVNIEVVENTNEEIKPGKFNLILISKGTGDILAIPTESKVILGREAVGKDTFVKFGKVISRAHCMIEYEKGAFYLTDLNSVTGTFLGSSKIDCQLNPHQLITNGIIIYFGREPFYTQITSSEDMSQTEPDRSELPGVVETPRKYECASCRSYWSEVREFHCPNCKTYNG